jgi:sugar/nucleoside kinase (ribokinase family)
MELMNKLEPSVKLSFSPGALYAARGINTLKSILARTHILFTNEKEIKQLTGKDFSAAPKSSSRWGATLSLLHWAREQSIKPG